MTLGLAFATQGLAQQNAGPADSGPRTPAYDVFTASAPGRYTVMKGDTLWDIAGRFLKNPWRWPQIWQMNRDQIRNPHWIYPGQVIVLDRATGTMRLSGDTVNDTVNLSPRIRIYDERDAISSIPIEVIEPFLSQPLIVENAAMLDSPRIIASKDRVILSRGDSAYVSGITDPSIPSYQLFRPGRPLYDPDTRKIIAYQADYLGTADITRRGAPATAVITSFAKEIGIGDRLIPTVKSSLINYVPHSPEKPIRGRVVSIYDGVGVAGKNMVVALNRGKSDGLEIGHVLAAQLLGLTITDKTNGGRTQVKLPDELNGLMFVFRVFDHISYALITSSTEPVRVGDVFTEP